MAYEIHKFAGVLHALVAADEAVEASCTPHSSHGRCLKGSTKRANKDPSDQKSDNSEQNGQQGPFLRPLRGAEKIPPPYGMGGGG